MPSELPAEIEEKKKIETKKKEDIELMEKESYASASITAKLVLFVSIVLFFGGIFVGLFFDLSFPDNITGINYLDAILFNLGVFTLSIPFYAFLSPLVFALKGIMMSKAVLAHNIEAIKLIPLIISGYAGMKSALLLSEDLNGRLYFNKYARKCFLILIFGVIMALIVEYWLPLMPDIKII